jgi:hypothetical protein
MRSAQIGDAKIGLFGIRALEFRTVQLGVAKISPRYDRAPGIGVCEDRIAEVEIGQPQARKVLAGQISPHAIRLFA